MKRVLIWDIPTRLFHWSLAILFFTAFGIANFVSDDSAVFDIHMLLGFALGFIILLRLIWGVIGTKHARFSSFLFSPKALFEYLKGVMTGKAKKYAGHNPGASYAIFTMLLIPLVLLASGLMMLNGSEAAEEVHEILAYSMLAVVGAHIAGIGLHTIRHKEAIATSMVTGYKDGQSGDAIASARPLVGVIFIVLVGFFAGHLFKNYDAAARQLTIPLFGKTLYLGDDSSAPNDRMNSLGDDSSSDDELD